MKIPKGRAKKPPKLGWGIPHPGSPKNRQKNQNFDTKNLKKLEKSLGS